MFLLDRKRTCWNALFSYRGVSLSDHLCGRSGDGMPIDILSCHVGLFFEEVESDLLEILGFAVFTQTYPKSDLGMVRDPERDSEGESCDVGIHYHGWSQD